MTTTSKTSTNKYNGKAELSQNLGLTANKISSASASAVRIHTNCFPLRTLKSKMLEGSEECIEA